MGLARRIPAQAAHRRRQGIGLHPRRLVEDLVPALDLVYQDEPAEVVEGLELVRQEVMTVRLFVQDVLDRGRHFQQRLVVVVDHPVLDGHVHRDSEGEEHHGQRRAVPDGQPEPEGLGKALHSASLSM